uniref:Uncharacterized protein n=1 Tax=Romanomermis culicivorax TaxID=13658 RepID=A0A915HYM8_ROMCU
RKIAGGKKTLYTLKSTNFQLIKKLQKRNISTSPFNYNFHRISNKVHLLALRGRHGLYDPLFAAGSQKFGVLLFGLRVPTFVAFFQQFLTRRLGLSAFVARLFDALATSRVVDGRLSGIGSQTILCDRINLCSQASFLDNASSISCDNIGTRYPKGEMSLKLRQC